VARYCLIVAWLAVAPELAHAQRVRVQVLEVEAPSERVVIRESPCASYVVGAPCTSREREAIPQLRPRLAVQIRSVVGLRRASLAHAPPRGEPVFFRAFRRLRTRWFALDRVDAIEIDVRDGERLIDQLVLAPAQLLSACGVDVSVTLEHGARVVYRVDCPPGTRAPPPALDGPIVVPDGRDRSR
jgi:hypothetical protein